MEYRVPFHDTQTWDKTVLTFAKKAFHVNSNSGLYKYTASGSCAEGEPGSRLPLCYPSAGMVNKEEGNQNHGI